MLPPHPAPATRASVRAFLVVGMLLAVPALIAHFRLGRYGLHVALNSGHTQLGDQLLPVFTELANGWVPVILALVLLRKSWRTFLMMGLGTGLSAIAVQLLKHLVFAGYDRPAMFLEEMPGLQLVAGMDLHHHFSFPSGHSTAAFSMCLALAVVIGNRAAAIGLAVLAALLALSRVYLSQHFTEDILAGALVGTVVTTAVFGLLYQGRYAHDARLDRSPFKRVASA